MARRAARNANRLRMGFDSDGACRSRPCASRFEGRPDGTKAAGLGCGGRGVRPSAIRDCADWRIALLRAQRAFLAEPIARWPTVGRGRRCPRGCDLRRADRGAVVQTRWVGGRQPPGFLLAGRKATGGRRLRRHGADLECVQRRQADGVSGPWLPDPIRGVCARRQAHGHRRRRRAHPVLESWQLRHGRFLSMRRWSRRAPDRHR